MGEGCTPTCSPNRCRGVREHGGHLGRRGIGAGQRVHPRKLLEFGLSAPSRRVVALQVTRWAAPFVFGPPGSRAARLHRSHGRAVPFDVLQRVAARACWTEVRPLPGEDVDSLLLGSLDAVRDQVCGVGGAAAGHGDVRRCGAG